MKFDFSFLHKLHEVRGDATNYRIVFTNCGKMKEEQQNLKRFWK